MMDNQSVYLKHLMPIQKSLLELESHAATHHIPIMDKVSMQFLCQLIRIHRPSTILEVGTAIGYSAINIAQSVPETSIVTMEKDAAMVEIAKENIERFDLSKRIDVIQGDALEGLESFNNTSRTFDIIFIDAAKGKYEQFFTLAAPLLSKDGIIVCDNVLFRGFVAKPENAPSPRLKKLALKIRNFNEWLMNHKDFITTIVPIGDGMAISKKKSFSS